MKTAWTAVTWIVLAAVGAGVAAPAARALATDGPGHSGTAVLVCDRESVDLGTLSDADALVHAFTLTNTSDRPVRLVMTYCHFCTPPTLTKPVLKPGEQGQVILEIDGAERKGKVQATATIGVANQRGADINIELKAELRPRLWVEPRQAFPKIVRGRGLDMPLTVIGSSPDFRVARVETGSPLIKADVGPAEKGEDMGLPCSRQTLTLRFSPELPMGPLAATVRVACNDPTAPPRDVLIQGRVVGRVRAEPETVGCEAQVGAPFAMDFDVVGEDCLGLAVESVDVGDRSEATGVVLDMRPTPDPARWRGRVTGYAPERPRTSVEIPLTIVARPIEGGEGAEPEEVRVMVSMVVPRPKDDVPVP
jgi:hypothetical protein